MMKLSYSPIFKSCLFVFILCAGATAAMAEAAAPDNGAALVLSELEAMAARVAEAPGNCDVIRAEAKAFKKKYDETLKRLSANDSAPANAQVKNRLDAVFAQLSPSIALCGSCAAAKPADTIAKDANTASKDDPCKDTKKKCKRNCPLSGWDCAQHWAGCMAGYRPSCCWAAACGSMKNCMRVCQSSCVCSVD